MNMLKKKKLIESQWAPNIATTDENLNAINQLFQERSLPALADSIFTKNIIHGPTAALFGVTAGNNGLQIVRNDVEVNDIDYQNPLKLNVSFEVLEDIRRQYENDAEVFIANYLCGLANSDENQKVLAFLASNAVQKDAISFDNTTDPEEIWTKLSYKITNLIIEMNSPKLRTWKAFVVLPYTYATSIMSLFAGLDNAELANSCELFAGRSGMTEWYINPDANATDIYVGLKDDGNLVHDLGITNSGYTEENHAYNGCAYVSRYSKEITKVVSPEGNGVAYFIYNRYALTMNPLHTNQKPMLVKFSIS